jgi:hypothetical protein
MNCHGTKHLTLRWAACCAVLGVLLAAVPIAQAVVIVNDSFADGGRNNGADPLDSNWWASSSLNGIEVSAGSLGMVTGSTGRGIHTVFPTQTLANVGDRLVATYTFRTPANVGSGGAAGFRAGLFDTLGRAGLDADIEASSAAPSPLYGLFSTPTAALPGYMLDMDVGTGTEDINFRQHDTVPTAATPTGRLMGTTTGFTNVSPSMLQFWANSNLFGVSNTPGEANNGIDFSNVRIEFIPVPEPASLVLFGLCWMMISARGCRGNAVEAPRRKAVDLNSKRSR